MQFVEVIVRQAHPGDQDPHYTSLEQKMQDAREYRRQESLPWTVLVDDLEGTTHQVYGGLSDPAYLIDADGRVAFYHIWTHAPTIHTTIEQLLGQGGRGVVEGGVDKQPHLLPAIADGWRGLRRGLPQSLIDMDLALPGSGIGTFLGYQLRSVLAPVALRAEPLPAPARAALRGAALGATVAVLSLLLRRRWR